MGCLLSSKKCEKDISETTVAKTWLLLNSFSLLLAISPFPFRISFSFVRFIIPEENNRLLVHVVYTWNNQI